MSIKVKMPESWRMPSIKLDKEKNTLTTFVPVLLSPQDATKVMTDTVSKLVILTTDLVTGNEKDTKEIFIDKGTILDASLVFNEADNNVLFNCGKIFVIDLETNIPVIAGRDDINNYYRLCNQIYGEATCNMGVIPNEDPKKTIITLLDNNGRHEVKDSAGISRALSLMDKRIAQITFTYLGELKHKKFGTCPYFYANEIKSIVYVENNVTKRIKCDYDNAHKMTGGCLMTKVTSNGKYRLCFLSASAIELYINGCTKELLRDLKHSTQVKENLRSVVVVDGKDRMLFSVKDQDGAPSLARLVTSDYSLEYVAQLPAHLVDKPYIIFEKDDGYDFIEFE